MGHGLLPDVGWGLQNHAGPWLPLPAHRPSSFHYLFLLIASPRTVLPENSCFTSQAKGNVLGGEPGAGFMVSPCPC